MMYCVPVLSTLPGGSRGLTLIRACTPANRCLSCGIRLALCIMPLQLYSFDELCTSEVKSIAQVGQQ